MLVRHYIHRRLLDYYSQPAVSVVGSALSSSKAVTQLSHNPFAAAFGWASNNNDHHASDTIRGRVPFIRLCGEWHWKHVYRQLYRQTSGQWLTPSELFAPYYTQCLAQYILAQHAAHEEGRRKNNGASPSSDDSTTFPSMSLHIIELGGGRGTNALAMLDYIQRVAPTVYEQCRYTLADFSPTLHEHQQQQVQLHEDPTKQIGCHRHAEKLQFRSLDLMTVAETSDKRSLLSYLESPPTSSKSNSSDATTSSVPSHGTHTVVLGLELLDNLPHDKIVVPTAAETSSKHNHPQQVELENGDVNDDNIYREVLAPLQDPLLQQVLQHYPVHLSGRHGGNNSNQHATTLWIPTVACGVLQALAQECRTNHRNNATTALLADFDSFPSNVSSDSQTNEIGRPIVTDMNDVDYPSYLTRPKTPTDILFPTDFVKLALYCDAVFADSNATTSVVQQGQFLLRHGPADAVAATRSWLTGYSPMVEDFINCTVLTVSTSSLSPSAGSE